MLTLKTEDVATKIMLINKLLTNEENMEFIYKKHGGKHFEIFEINM